MWSVELLVGVTLICAGSILVVGIIMVRKFEHRCDRELLNSHVVTQRRLSAYHRAQLSVDGNSYSHVTQPNSNLRRSTYLPYGNVVEGWASVPSKEHIRPEQMSEQPDDDLVPSKGKRRRSMRQKSNGRSFQVLKTRRRKEIEKVIPLNSMQRSPLSAITEFTDPTSDDQSPVTDIVEIPTDVIPKDNVGESSVNRPADRPLSIQWPLPVAQRRLDDTAMVQQTSAAARKSMLLRMNGINRATLDGKPSLAHQSFNISSNISMVPDEPLPPLPPLKIRGSPQRHDALRLSMTSVESVGSSILRTVLTSPSRRDVNSSPVGPRTSQINLYSPGLQGFNYPRTDDEPSAVTLGFAAGKHGGYCRGQPTSGSFSATVETQKLLRNAGLSHHRDRQSSKTGGLRNFGFPIEKADTSSWDLAPYVEKGPRACRFSPSLPSPAQRDGSRCGRYSMFESQMPNRRRSTARQAWEPETDNGDEDSAILMPPRPASVASSHPSEYNANRSILDRNLNLKEPTSRRKKGHKRQNCMRISNLPPPKPISRTARLLQMTEVDEDEPDTYANEQVKVPGLTSLETGEPALRMRPSLVDIKTLPSPFQNCPILEPTSRSRQPNSRRSDSYCSEGVSRPDSDVFDTSHNDPVNPNIFARTISPRTWPLSPTLKDHLKPNSTPTAMSEPDEFFDHDSPTLPSPIYNSAVLFPRNSTVKGSRQPPKSEASSRTASPSPAGYRNMAGRPGDGLRRSVMMLRRMGSDGKLLDRNGTIYRNIGDENADTFWTSANLRPPYESSTNLASSRFNATSNGTHLRSTDKKRTMKRGLTSFRVSRSKMNMALSPSAMSLGGSSIWEDASVPGASPEPELPTGGLLSTLLAIDSEDYENLVEKRRGEKVLKREERLMSPQVKGLGLTVGNVILGTPGSLYDHEGFLKDY